MSISQRINDLIEGSPYKPAEVSRRARITKSAMSQITAGETKTLRGDTLLRLAELFKVSPWFILYGTDPPFASACSNARIQPAHTVQQAREDPTAAWHRGEAASACIELPEGWLEAHGAKESECRFVMAPDDSMQPYIRRGDTVIFDANQRALRPGHRYVVRVEGETAIRRATGYGDRISLRTDRNGPGDESVSADAGYTVEVLGRVCCALTWDDP